VDYPSTRALTRQLSYRLIEGCSHVGDFLHEAYLSTLCRPKEAHARISRPHAHARRPSGPSGATRQGAGSPKRLSERRRLSRKQRLGTTDVAALLSGARAIKRPGLSVVLKANAIGICRLGLIVPKRVFPRAVDRNRAKRMLREWFRGHQERLGSRDILIRLTAGSLTAENVLLAEIERCLTTTS